MIRKTVSNTDYFFLQYFISLKVRVRARNRIWAIKVMEIGLGDLFYKNYLNMPYESSYKHQKLETK